MQGKGRQVMEKFKVKTKQGKEAEFEKYCLEKNIGFRAYPMPIERTYVVNCILHEIVDVGDCIEQLEDMPTAALD